MEDWGRYIEAVADALLGKPTSRKSGELRYGKRGSLKVNIETGFWDDFEAGDGGGTLALIKREKGMEGKEAIDWMRDTLGLDIEDRRPQQQGRASSAQSEREPDRRPDPKPAAPKAKPKLVKTYDYTAESGELLFQVCRMEPKNFLQRRPARPDDDPSDVRGEWVWKRDGITQVPYRLTELIEAVADERTIFVVEGEKDVDNLADLGVPATCNAGGAGKWPDELTPYFKDADVVIIRDNDPQAKNPQTGELRWHPDGRPVLPGQDHGMMVAGKLRGTAKRVRILDLPNLPLKGDTTDWLEAGGTSSELYQLVGSIAKLYEPKPFVSKFGAVMWGAPRATRTPYQYVIKGLIPRKETVLIYGASQSGKSFFTQDLAMAVARGGDYLGRKVRRGLVVYCAAEAGAGFVYNRFAGYAAGKGISEDEYLPFICLTKKFDLFGNEQQVIELIAEIKVLVANWNEMFPDDQLELEAVVIDTLNKTTPGMDEINGKEVGLVMSRLDRIREECDCGLWLVHHMNAGGTGPRGHTSLYAAFETAIKIGRYDHTAKDAPAKIADGNKLRDRRFTQITKQREGEDGEITDFFLRGVIAGYDEDNAPIPGAVVEWIDADPAARVKQAEEEAGINMTDQNRNTYRALRRALEEFGVAPPPRLGLPKSVDRVVEAQRWSQIYRENFAADASDDAVRKAIQRGNNFMIDKGIMARSNPFVWITGKRIRGVPKRPDPVDREEEATPPSEESSRVSTYFDQGEPEFGDDAEMGDMPVVDGPAMQPPFDATQIGGPAE
ncbi:AAA family ATPase [Bradyrhizobium erythrophlei]|uniref:AAA domain-containing protein n=1 Tax=Bradyrhizobium erythrophlei TaxID=1437360 RepID=A0A1M5NDI3_9BRAD|nr:AAA family ATPase [Bradyrhizobium erythrophlei]SHG87571.1 AAA domain-containing protein [Bradyrhizobium erythrophlei]